MSLSTCLLLLLFLIIFLDVRLIFGVARYGLTDSGAAVAPRAGCPPERVGFYYWCFCLCLCVC